MGERLVGRCANVTAEKYRAFLFRLFTPFSSLFLQQASLPNLAEPSHLSSPLSLLPNGIERNSERFGRRHTPCRDSHASRGAPRWERPRGGVCFSVCAGEVGTKPRFSGYLEANGRRGALYTRKIALSFSILIFRFPGGPRPSPIPSVKSNSSPLKRCSPRP
jgi:hypothetical protein